MEYPFLESHCLETFCDSDSAEIFCDMVQGILDKSISVTGEVSIHRLEYAPNIFEVAVRFQPLNELYLSKERCILFVQQSLLQQFIELKKQQLGM